ncbi:MAG: response regulator transcription factor [Planctomycetales bacterium]|nr:response regulator transcription factor [Planctomycetales bacterium]
MLEQGEKTQRSLAELLDPNTYLVFSASNRATALRQLYLRRPDLVLLDLDVPELDGWALIRQMVEIIDVPIVACSSYADEEYIVETLDAGAVDYLVKPIRSSMLNAHIHAALRYRSPAIPDELPAYNDGYLQIDIERYQVMVGGTPIRLSSTEFKLLAYLVTHADRVLTFNQILENVWGWEYRDNRDYVYTYMGYLRQKIEVDPKQPLYLMTEHGIGYQFVKQRYATGHDLKPAHP